MQLPEVKLGIIGCRILTCVVFLLIIQLPVFAESAALSGDADSTKTIGCACFRGKPLPKCCSFWIIELGLKYRLSRSWYDAPDPSEAQAKTVLTADVGYMRNVTSRAAVGFTIYGAVDADKSRLGIRARYRRWLTPKTTFDISPGVLFIGGESGPHAFKSKYPGFVGTLSLGYADMISAGVQYEIIRFGRPNWWILSETDYEAQHTLYAGFTVGSYAGTAGIVGVGILMILVAATWD